MADEAGDYLLPRGFAQKRHAAEGRQCGTFRIMNILKDFFIMSRYESFAADQIRVPIIFPLIILTTERATVGGSVVAMD